jgi:phage-related holin
MAKISLKFLRQFTQYMSCFIFPYFAAIQLNTVFGNMFEKYIFGDWEFLRYLTVIVATDTILAVIYHIRSRTLSSRGFSMIFTKVISYSAMLIVANAARNIHTEVSIDNGGEWVASLICWSLFMREGLSIMEKLSLLNINVVPKKIMKYFREFNSVDDENTGKKDS